MKAWSTITFLCWEATAMRKMLSANLSRLWKSPSLWLFLVSILGLAMAFMLMQYTAMDYAVPLSRVIFLPLSLYGVAAAAFVSVFVGTDFSDGVIRNKILAARRRSDVVLSHIVTSCVGCAWVYLMTTAFCAGVSVFLFENDVTAKQFGLFLFLGLGMSLAYASLFCAITLLCGSKVQAIIGCMALSMLLLFLSLHTNLILVQEEFRNGVLNPHYATGIKRALYGILHDLNPCGQAAQLSAWSYFEPARGVLCSLFWVAAASWLSCALFRRKDLS